MNYPNIYTNAGIWRKRGITGRNTVIAVVDTGVYRHPDLTLLQGYSAIDGTPTLDAHGHGTHVAGIAAGRKYGVAPDAAILPVKISANGLSNAGYITKALDWLIEWRRSHVERLVVNISFTGTSAPAVLERINALVTLDVPVCVAAGNDGGEKSAFAEYESPIVVGNLVDGHTLAESSTCWGEDTDCAVIGSHVWSCSTAGGYVPMTGTSMASPAVAGMLALILSRWPEMTEPELYEYFVQLCTRSVPCGDGHVIPVPAFIDDFTEEVDNLRETKYIAGVSAGNQLVVTETADASSAKTGNLRNGDAVTVLGVVGDRALAAVGVCGYIPTKYLADEPPEADEPDEPEGERLSYTLKSYNSTVKVTEADADKLIGKRHKAGDFLLRNDLGPHLISPSLIELMEAAEDEFGGRMVFPTTNSLYRTDASNKAAGGASGSRHKMGYAADFRIRKHDDSYAPREALAKWAEAYMTKRGWAGGIGVYAGSSEHIHVDLRGSWTFWWKVTSGSKTPGFGGRPVTFREGSRSPAIAEIQARLNVEGYTAGGADGVFGAKTKAALKKWQSANGLSADGIYGAGTNRVMGLFEW